MHTRRRYFAALVAFLFANVVPFLAPVVCAQNGQPAQPALVPGQVHVGSTRIYVHVYKTGLGHEHAVAGLVKEGVIHLGATSEAGYVVADLTSFVADPDFARKYLGLEGMTDASTQKKVTANMLGPDVLNVQRYPITTARFRSAQKVAQASPRGLPQYKLEGDLTLHDVSRPLNVIAEAEEKDGWVILRTKWSLLQTDFGIKPYSLAFGSIGVADRLDFVFEGYLAKER